MNKKLIVAILVLVVACLVVVKYFGPAQSGGQRSVDSPSTPTEAPRLAVNSTPSVPAHYDNPPSALLPTLAPDKFPGKAREAYQAAKDIPQLLAQLPCYCYCDRGMGHKSLHSCFEDDHAAHCDVCVNEALLAYRLHKDQQLSPKEIRERIIATYSKQ